MFHHRRPSQVQMKNFARIIREARIRLGLTQEQLAEKLDCSAHWINNVERAKSNLNWVDTINLLVTLQLDPGKIAEEVGIGVSVPANRK